MHQAESILDGKAGIYQAMIGSKPSIIPLEEMVTVVSDNPEYRRFMGGSTPILPQGYISVNWWCAWICFLPGIGVACVFWKPTDHVVQ
jgi:hypothetical protein